MHFTLLGPRLQVASPQLSMHGSNILIDGESACGCGLRSFDELQATFLFTLAHSLGRRV